MDFASAEPRSVAGPEPRAAAASRSITHESLGPLFAGYVFPFTVVVYLAFQGGGYDAVVRSEVGIAIWWAVLLAGLVGVAPSIRLSRGGWIVAGSLVGLVAWTALGIGWSESAERSVGEMARTVALLGVFALSLSVHGKAGLRRVLLAVAAAVTVVAGAAVLSRLQPALLGDNEARQFLPTTQARLNYPLDYWNGLATLMAMGVPLLLWATSSVRSIMVRVAANAAIPLACLAAYFTLSRGGAVELGLAVGALLALHPRRLTLLPSLLVSGFGAVILVIGASQRAELADGLTTAAAHTQGDEMTVMAVVVVAGVALLSAAVALMQRFGVGPRASISRGTTTWVTAGSLAVLVTVGLALGGPGAARDAWTEFKSPDGPGEGVGRFDSASGNGRYQWWQTAIDANAEAPVVGIGPGTYEYFWAEKGEDAGFVRDAHSLYLEALAELGVVGLVLVLGLVGGAVAAAATRALSREDVDRSAAFAAATATMAAFACSAAIDWSWEMTILPVIFLIVTAATLRADDDRAAPPDAGRMRLSSRGVVCAVAAVALLALLIPMASTEAVRSSQASFNAGELDSALEEAERAVALQPYAASPHVQLALVLEQRGDTAGALAQASAATSRESTNWRTWLVLSRLEANEGNTAAAIDAYRRARDLNPRSPLFAQ